MAQSTNTKVEYKTKAASYSGIGSYGNIMLGDKAFEYYNEKNPEDYIQIPWDQVDYIAASVYFKKYITRFAVFIKGGNNRYFAFSAKNNKALLRACKAHVPEDRLQKAPTLLKVMGDGVRALFHLGRKSGK